MAEARWRLVTPQSKGSPPVRPPRPKPQENRRPSSISATLWNLAAATAVTRRRRSASSRAGAVATLVDPVPCKICREGCHEQDLTKA